MTKSDSTERSPEGAPASPPSASAASAASLEPVQRDLLRELGNAAERGSFAVACDGPNRAAAHALEKLGLADWRGTNWGSSFWTITVAGLAALAEGKAEDAFHGAER